MPLTKAKLAHLERRLNEERARILEDLDRFKAESSDEDEQDRSGDLSTLPYHPADRGTDTMRGELAASNASRQSQELAEIDAALERLISSPEQFGLDENTGELIPFERLDLVPWARAVAPPRSAEE